MDLGLWPLIIGNWPSNNVKIYAQGLKSPPDRDFMEKQTGKSLLRA